MHVTLVIEVPARHSTACTHAAVSERCMTCSLKRSLHSTARTQQRQRGRKGVSNLVGMAKFQDVGLAEIIVELKAVECIDVGVCTNRAWVRP